MIKSEMGTVEISGESVVIFAEFEGLLAALKNKMHLTDEKIVEILVRSDRCKVIECSRKELEATRKENKRLAQEFLKDMDKE